MFYWTYKLIRRIAAKVRLEAVEFFSIRPVMRGIGRDALILEIGGGYRPRFTKEEYPNVFHMDHSNTHELRVKYAADPSVGHLIDQIQRIDFVADGSPLEEIVPADLRFDVVFSSHAIEHQVDLIRHFASLEKLLRAGGRVIMVVPDHRCTFDVLRYPSVAGDAIAVHLRGAAVHKGKQIFEHISRTIDISLGWKIGRIDLAGARFNNPVRRGAEAIRRSEQPGAGYEDAHAWIFSPLSFRLLMLEIYMLGYTRLRPSMISYTYSNQFCVVLERDDRYSSPPNEIMDELETERLALSKRLRR